MKPLINKVLAGLAPIAISVRKRKLVLCYHRFSEAGYDDPFFNPVSTMPLAELRKQLKWLLSFADIVDLETLLNSDSSDWQVAITIDDGYKDVADLALPVFESMNTPVTWFIATRPVEDASWIPWWDMAAWIQRQTSGQLTLNTDDLTGSFELAEASSRQQIAATLRKLALFNGIDAAEQLVSSISSQLEVPDNAFIRPADLLAIKSSPILTLAPHTHQHPNLALLSKSEQENEFNVSYQKLEEWGLNPAKWLAYPFGKEWARSMDTHETASALGYKGAFTTNIDFVEADTNPHTVPRISVDGRWNMAAFQARTVFAPIQQRVKAALR
ncbi:polysaccharide deacetylase family protein [Oceanobacter kriegii]|uniref:polysaccharide deacetylase family protein n=1 Tax=Oceanobacter kriegii TaxID=64972 RepID=UPI00041C6E64|nr:polysaccharide deacetylase family protein [Oceanobacter kriegii]